MSADCTIQDVFNRFYPEYTKTHELSAAQRKAALNWKVKFQFRPHQAGTYLCKNIGRSYFSKHLQKVLIAS